MGHVLRIVFIALFLAVSFYSDLNRSLDFQKDHQSTIKRWQSGPRQKFNFGYFIQNSGQWDEAIKYVFQGQKNIVLFSESKIQFVFPQNKKNSTVITQNFSGGKKENSVRGLVNSKTQLHYFRAKKQFHSQSFSKVLYTELYPHVDLDYYFQDGHLEYDFILNPGAEPRDIGIVFPDADTVSLNESGDLIVKKLDQVLIHKKPYAYQIEKGRQVPIETSFQIENDQVKFKVSKYDRKKILMIDPLTNVRAATYIGGSGSDDGQSVAVASDGSVYFLGKTFSTDFPSYGGYDSSLDGLTDILVAKFSADLGTLISATYIGGGGYEFAGNIAVNENGVYISGDTESTDFPTTGGDTVLGGSKDAVILLLNSDLSSILASTYLGGSGSESFGDLALGSDGSVYLAGDTSSADFPSTGGYDTSLGGGSDVFLAKFSASLGNPIVATYLGGSSWDYNQSLALLSDGSVVVAGRTDSSDFPVTGGDTSLGGSYDGFLAILNSDLNTLTAATLLGGSSTDFIVGISVDSSNNIFATGRTQSSDFPANIGDTSYNGSLDAFLTKFSSSLGNPVASTFLGGSGGDYGQSVLILDDGSVFISGVTGSSDFPIVNGTNTLGGFQDYFLAKFDASLGDPSFSSFMGGSESDGADQMALGLNGEIYVAGWTSSNDFPAYFGYDTSLSGSSDAFLAYYLDSSRTLTNANIAQEEQGMSLSGNLNLSFTTDLAFYATDKMRITFPQNYDLSQIESDGAECSSFDGIITTSVSGQNVMLTRASGSNYSAGDISCTLSQVVNPDQIGNPGTFAIAILDMNENVLATQSGIQVSDIEAVTLSVSINGSVAPMMPVKSRILTASSNQPLASGAWKILQGDEYATLTVIDSTQVRIETLAAEESQNIEVQFLAESLDGQIASDSHFFTLLGTQSIQRKLLSDLFDPIIKTGASSFYQIYNQSEQDGSVTQAYELNSLSHLILGSNCQHDEMLLSSSDDLFLILNRCADLNRLYISQKPLNEFTANVFLANLDLNSISALVVDDHLNQSVNTQGEFVLWQGSSSLGQSILLMDLDEDGLEEILLSSPSEGDFGLIYVFSWDGILEAVLYGSETFPVQGLYFLDDNRPAMVLGPLNNTNKNGLITEKVVSYSDAVSVFYPNSDISGRVSIDSLSQFGDLSLGSEAIQNLKILDVNSDGNSDFIVVNALGEVDFFHGPFTDSFSLGESDVITQLSGGTAEFGSSLEFADVNGDGLGDLIAGDPLYGENGEGAIYIIFGPYSDWNSPIDVTSENNVLVLVGEKDENLGEDLLVVDSNSDGVYEIYTRVSSGETYYYDLGSSQSSVTQGDLKGAGCVLSLKKQRSLSYYFLSGLLILGVLTMFLNFLWLITLQVKWRYQGYRQRQINENLLKEAEKKAHLR